jgi:hypothetical protein
VRTSKLDADPAHALDVFEHPYAYAAFMGVPYDEELLASGAHASDQPPGRDGRCGRSVELRWRAARR